MKELWKKLIEKISNKFIIETELEDDDYYISDMETEDIKLIFGIKSYDDLTSHEANLWTLNDFYLLYNKNTGKYFIDIETIYSFNDLNGDIIYINDILNKFTKWMKENNYNTDARVNLYTMFTHHETEFNSIEDAYAMFKIWAKGYCSQIGDNKNED